MEYRKKRETNDKYSDVPYEDTSVSIIEERQEVDFDDFTVEINKLHRTEYLGRDIKVPTTVNPADTNMVTVTMNSRTLEGCVVDGFDDVFLPQFTQDTTNAPKGIYITSVKNYTSLTDGRVEVFIEWLELRISRSSCELKKIRERELTAFKVGLKNNRDFGFSIKTTIFISEDKVLSRPSVHLGNISIFREKSLWYHLEDNTYGPANTLELKLSFIKGKKGKVKGFGKGGVSMITKGLVIPVTCAHGGGVPYDADLMIKAKVPGSRDEVRILVSNFVIETTAGDSGVIPLIMNYDEKREAVIGGGSDIVSGLDFIDKKAVGKDGINVNDLVGLLAKSLVGKK